MSGTDIYSRWRQQKLQRLGGDRSKIHISEHVPVVEGKEARDGAGTNIMQACKHAEESG